MAGVDIWECALGFMDSQALLTAEELGVFDVLDAGPRTAGEVAEGTGLPQESAERLLVALCALRLVRKAPDGRYVNGPEASEKLVRGKPGYAGAMFHHVRDVLYPAWNYCKEALQEGRAQWELAFPGGPPPTEDQYSNPPALRAFMEGMHTITYAPAAEFASRAEELREVRSVVDVGGASGAFLIALAEQFPELRGVVFDLPQVQPIAEDFIRRAGFSDRLRFQSGDFWNDPLPEGADAYSMGFILHDWDREGGSKLLRKISEAAPEGALLILGEYLLNDDKTGPLQVARQSMNMLVTAQGMERSAPEYGEWIREFGFELEKIHLTSSAKNFMVARKVPVAARRPRGRERTARRSAVA
ncbi:MAG TPA: methyltransferase [Longimicrobiaceae bacterium]|nr:methyltransferase [Longimicrobiaceae bacterium]